MATAGELIVAEQLGQLREIGDSRSWPYLAVDVNHFTIRLPAKDGNLFWSLIDHEQFPTLPAAFHWYDPESKAVDLPADTPKGTGGYLHDHGRICAPWNRLAYTQVNPDGLHGDWELANWMTNPKTGATTTLAAQVLRIHRELNGPNYDGRLEQKAIS